MPQAEKRITSGIGAQGVVHIYEKQSWPAYFRYWLSGPDAGLFSTQIDDDDDDPANGFAFSIRTTRPLPSGTYRVVHHGQPYWYEPCGFTTQFNLLEWVVTVTAPTDTVHEALFDPADLFPGIGFSSTAGTLDPAGFTFGGTATTVTGLKWEAGSVVLALSPYVSLAGQAVDFIGLDGTVSLSLGAAAATADSTAGTLTWPVASQPWKAGDKLMVRVR